MKTKTTLKSFQKNTKVKALTAKQRKQVSGGLCVAKAKGQLNIIEKDTENQPESEVTHLLEPMAYF